jgi:trans-aconitate methyltransferase
VEEVLASHPHAPYDIVVCAEVLYLCREYRQILRALAGTVRPGGLLCVSHRPKFYYLLEALKQYDLTSAAAVASHSEGPFRDAAYYNWQTADELRQLYASMGLQWVACYPIDRFAWLGGISPATLSQEQRDQLLRLELESPHGAECARYVLVIAQR